MVATFIRLKLTLIGAGLRAINAGGAIGFAFAALLTVVVGVSAAVLLALLRVAPATTYRPTLLGVFAGIYLAWVALPITFAGSENAIEVTRLILFPLTRRDLVLGMTASAMVSFGFVTTVIALVGAVAGMAPSSPAAVVTALAAVELALLCLISSRLITSALSAAITRGRGRTFALLVGPSLAISGQMVRFLPDTETTERVLTAIGRALPSGAPALAMTAARDGDLGLAATALAAGAALVALAAVLWGHMLDRALTTPPSEDRASPLGRQARRAAHPRWAPMTPAGAVFVKELRMTWRDPRQRAALVSSCFGGLGILPAFAVTGFSPSVVYFAVATAFFQGMATTNLYGFDGRAYWMNVAASADVRADLVGRSMARAFTVAIVCVPLAALLAVIGDGGRNLLPAMGIAAAALGLTLGGGLWVSVTVPVPLPEDRGNVFSAGNPGQGMRALGPSLLLLLVTSALLVPFALGVMVAGDEAEGRLALSVIGPAVGWAAWRTGLQAAVRRSRDRQPELLAELDPRA